MSSIIQGIKIAGYPHPEGRIPENRIFFLGLISKIEYVSPIDWHNLFVNNILRKRIIKNERRGLRQYQSLSPMQ
jgi:hypothetical protein